MVEKIDVLGLGNSLVDLIAEADDAYLEGQDMAKVKFGRRAEYGLHE